MKIKNIKLIMYILFIFVFIISISIPIIEFSIISKLNKDIHNISQDLEYIYDVIRRNEFYTILLNTELSVGRLSEAFDEIYKTELLRTVSKERYESSKNTTIEICKNINRLSDYIHMSIDCTKLYSSDEEMKKINEGSNKISKVRVNAHIIKDNKEHNLKKWTTVRNILYMMLISFTGFASALKYIIEKIENESRTKIILENFKK